MNSYLVISMYNFKVELPISYFCKMLQPQGDEYFMRQALREAEMAFDADEVPVGAVIVAKGIIIARGHNLTERLHDSRRMLKCKHSPQHQNTSAESTLINALCM